MIALATCRQLPDWEVDDRPFHEALAALDVPACQVAWDDPEVRWEAFELVLIRTTWDYTHKRAAFLEWSERVDRVSRLLNPARIVRWNTHKSYLRDLADRGVPVVPTYFAERGERADLAEILRARGWERGFLKPMVGASSERTLRFGGDEMPVAAGHLRELLKHDGVLVQPYLASVETEGELSQVYVDGRFSHGVRKIPVPGDYRVQDDHGASDEPYAPDERELAFGRAVVEAAGVAELLYARVDYLRGDDGEPRLVELELVEPSLFFRHDPTSPRRFAEAVARRRAAS